MKKINKNDIQIIIICTILFIYSILVGSPIKDNTKTINLVVLILFVIYILEKLIRDKEYKIVKRKIDIFILMLAMSSYIALIFQTYSNLDATIEYIIKYTTLFAIYIVIRDIVLIDKKYINYIINTIIASGISMFILGLDDLTFNIFQGFINITNNVDIVNPDNRFFGIFGYANTAAIFMLIVSIFSIDRYLKSDKKIQKIYYNLTTFFSMTAIIVSYSRATWIIAIFAYIFYLLIAKKEKIEYLEILFRTGIVSLIYSFMVIRQINTENAINIWINLVIFMIITSISSIISTKTVTILKKIKIRYYILIGILFLIAIIVIWNIGLKMKEPLVLFNDIDISKETLQEINDVKPNETYKIELDLEAKAAFSNDKIYVIQICERNKYRDIIKTHNITFGTFEGIKTLDFTTTEYTNRIIIKFKTANPIAQRGLKINSLKINNEEIVLKYKFLPKTIVERVRDIKLNTINVRERNDYLIDSIKIIKQNGLLGIGADGWKDWQLLVQDFNYYANENHSYILEVFCEFGVIGFLAVILIIIQISKIMITDIIKQNSQNQTILLGVIVLILHSFVDFDLSFMYMLVLLFSMIAIIDTKKVEYKKLEIFIKIFTILIVAISIGLSINVLYLKQNPKEINISNIQEMVKRRKYNSHTKLCDKIVQENNLNTDEYIKLYDIIKNESQLINNDIEMRIERIDFFNTLLYKLQKNEEKKQECKETILTEIQSAEELLEKPEVCRLSFRKIEEYKERMNNIKNNIEKENGNEIHY